MSNTFFRGGGEKKFRSGLAHLGYEPGYFINGRAKFLRRLLYNEENLKILAYRELYGCRIILLG